MRRTLALTTVLLISLCAATAPASLVVKVNVITGDDEDEFEFEYDDIGKVAKGIQGSGETTDSIDGGEFSFNVDADADPFIQYGFSFLDFGEPSSVSLVIIWPITLPNGETVALNEILGGSTTGALTMTPLGSAFLPADTDGVVELQHAGLSADGGATFVNFNSGAATTPFDVGLSFTTQLGTDTYPQYLEPGPVSGTFAAGPDSPWTTMAIETSFELTGGGVTFSVQGRAEIKQEVPVIPEPGSGLVWSVMAASIGMVRLRFRGRRN